jgi:hypothetical protein
MINKQKDTMIKTTNPFSGQSIDLTEEEHKLYMGIKNDEILAQETENDDYYENMQKKIDKFSRMNVKAYMVLVD